MRLPVLSALAAVLLLTPAALAQDHDDDFEIRAKRVTIEVDDDGNVLVDGKRVSEDDGAVVLRVEPENGEVEVEAVGPRGRRIIVRDRRPGATDRIFFRGDHPLMDDFDIELDMPHVKHLAPMMERFRTEFGDPLRESLEEHWEVAELERESRETARKARRAEGTERAELESELRRQLDEIFDKKLELREARVGKLQEKLAEQRDKLDRRRAAREDMIERRLRTLMGEDDILDW